MILAHKILMKFCIFYLRIQSHHPNCNEREEKKREGEKRKKEEEIE